MNIDQNFKINRENHLQGFKWIDPRESNSVKVYGFLEVLPNKPYNRIPERYLETLKKVTPNVVQLAKNTSGGQIHFRTTSSKIVINVELSDNVNLSNMTATAQAGFDMYVGSSYDNLLFYDSARFQLSEKTYSFSYQTNSLQDKLIVLNFPLYNGVNSLEIGLEENSEVKPSFYSNAERIVIYGTSITQGGCVSRPGLSYPNVLSRRFKREVINFGFSGNAFGEKELSEIVSEIANVGVFVLDYEANAGTNGKLELTLETFIKTIRKNYPTTPIAVVSRIKYLFDDLNPTLGKRREEIRVFQEQLVKRLNSEGDLFVYYLDGSKFLGDDYHEYTVDSIHPNDLGMMKIADCLEKEIKKFYI